jgi:hypothetical protein
VEVFRRINFFAAARPAYCKHSAPRPLRGRRDSGEGSPRPAPEVLVLGHIGDLAHNLDFERSFFPVGGAHHTLDGSPKNSLHGVALSRLGERPLVA